MKENIIVTAALEHSKSLINYSELKEFYANNPYRAFSIKFVAEGTEWYKANGVRHKVIAGEYMLANDYTIGEVIVEKKEAKGICIDISSDIINEVILHYQNKEYWEDSKFSKYLLSPDFLENKFKCNHTKVGAALLQIEKAIHNKGIQQLQFDKSFYYELVEKIIADYLPIYKELQQLPQTKTETRKELWRKLNDGKIFIDENYRNDLLIGTIAKEVGLSEYYFFRLFKTIYKTSPYQYIIKKRLEAAKLLLTTSTSNITEIATTLGFPDIFTFSKAFKKEFGKAPTHYKLC